MHDRNKFCSEMQISFKPGVARHLIKMGNPVYDIKPKKENPDASIFIFVETEKFVNDFTTILSTSE